MASRMRRWAAGRDGTDGSSHVSRRNHRARIQRLPSPIGGADHLKVTVRHPAPPGGHRSRLVADAAALVRWWRWPCGSPLMCCRLNGCQSPEVRLVAPLARRLLEPHGLRGVCPAPRVAASMNADVRAYVGRTGRGLPAPIPDPCTCTCTCRPYPSPSGRRAGSMSRGHSGSAGSRVRPADHSFVPTRRITMSECS